ncbi:MAG: acyl-CoA/acyl-ACP dehydrogenase [Actinobacteria bacterium]|nr:acyl-CoA/acyl-ACP dehydrogenase [Actinomycetota bacterium]
MDLTVSETQIELRESVRGVLERECSAEVLRRRIEGGERPEALWQRMVELGWPALTIPTEYDGLGFGFAELLVVLEEIGRAAAPGPLLPTVTQLLPAVAREVDLLADIAAGNRTGSLVTGDLRLDGDAVQGTARHVLEGSWVDTFVVVVASEGDATVHLVDATQTQRTPEQTVDATRELTTVTFDAAPARQVGGRDLAEAVRDHATIGLACETVGTIQRLLTMTLDYVRVREQFDRPIGSFQAVKHQLADAHVATEKAQAVTWYAALTVAEDDPRRSLAGSMAKAAAGEAARLVAARAVQLHGGIGYTWEHDLHLYVKRARADAVLLGDPAAHRARVADLLGA